ncbi:MAG: histidine utilization repressor [Hyphomicrobiales bacterium]|nr:histidine utilization repressor [Hyphomicrobiales bacterium]
MTGNGNGSGDGEGEGRKLRLREVQAEAVSPGAAWTSDQEPQPLYQTIKRFVTDHIESGEWKPGHRIPSEAQIVKILGVSRMTVNRAIRELSAEGRVTRIQGVGTFVAQPRPRSTLLDIRSIRDEITDRGGEHSCRVVVQEMETASVPVSRALAIASSVPVQHVVLLHLEDGRPVQVEDRYVNPVVAPHFLDQDFTRTTPSDYLLNLLPVTEIEHNIESRLPDARECELLAIGAGTPVLELRRRSWSGRAVVTRVRLVGPGSVFSVGGRFRVGDVAPA